MWKISIYLISLLLLSLVIDETVCPRTPVKKKPKIHNTKEDKIHSTNSLSHMLNYHPFDDRNLKTVTPNNPNDPIQKYQTGHNNRVEYVHARITPQSIKKKGTPTNKATRKFSQTMGKPKDDAGHIIGNQLGGSGKSLHNIFPQNRNINRGVWSRQEKKIRELAKASGKPVDVFIQLYYPTQKSTRPDRFLFLSNNSIASHSAHVTNP